VPPDITEAVRLITVPDVTDVVALPFAVTVSVVVVTAAAASVPILDPQNVIADRRTNFADKIVLIRVFIACQLTLKAHLVVSERALS
jgi:hypothetical protein